MATPSTDTAVPANDTAVPANDDFSTVPTLPENTSLSYLAEGAANVIYRLSSPPDGPQFTHQLLRARKALPSAQLNRLAYAQLLHTFQPMFPDHLLLPTSLIRIPASVLARENNVLRTLEESGKRPLKRRGLYLEEAKEEFGYLIMDMSPHPLATPPPSSSSSSFLSWILAHLSSRWARPKAPVPARQTRQLLIEFKPKWIIQSPAALTPWRRCRTCALRLSKGQKNGFCPLDLSSRDEPRVRRAIQYLIPAEQPTSLQLRDAEIWAAVQGTITERIVRYLVDSELMPSLKGLHAALDPHGPVQIQTLGDAEKAKFVTAMTVRDLTVFLRIDLDQAEGEIAGVEAKIGDLDLKMGDAGKWAYWAGIEKTLNDDGWYSGNEEGAKEKAVWCSP